MIGQNKLLNKFNEFEYVSLPKSIILEGEYGCGKHTLINQLSQKYLIPINDISLQISNDLLLELFTYPKLTFYIIDIVKASNNKKINLLQNSILKFVEEPPQTANIFILCNNKNQLLPTIQNRCQIFSFEQYSLNELKMFSSDNSIEVISDVLYEVYNTPGKLLTLKDKNTQVKQLEDLIMNIITNIHKASVSNALTICNKIDFGNGGFNLDIFLHMMKRILVQEMKSTDKFNLLKQYYIITQQFCEQLTTLNVNRQTLFENYILNLKSVQI